MKPTTRKVLSCLICCTAAASAAFAGYNDQNPENYAICVCSQYTGKEWGSSYYQTTSGNQWTDQANHVLANDFYSVNDISWGDTGTGGNRKYSSTIMFMEY